MGKANRNPLVAAQDQQNVIPQCQIQVLAVQPGVTESFDALVQI